MITSVFSKSKPTNLIISVFVIAIACFVAAYKLEDVAFSYANLPASILRFILSSLAVLWLNFISSKNNLSQTAYFEVLLYSSFVLCVPETTVDISSIASNVFLLLGVRRVISLRSQKKVKQKLFDASLCIALASLCFSWSILFFFIIFLAVALQTENRIRHWLIPVAGCLSVFTIAYCVGFIFNYDVFAIMFGAFQFDFNYEAYSNARFIAILVVILGFGVWASWNYYKRINQNKKSVRPAYYIMLILLLIAFLINAVMVEKTGSAFIFLFAPLAVIISNYIESVKRLWLKDMLLGVFLILPLLLLLF